MRTIYLVAVIIIPIIVIIVIIIIILVVSIISIIIIWSIRIVSIIALIIDWLPKTQNQKSIIIILSNDVKNKNPLISSSIRINITWWVSKNWSDRANYTSY